MKQHLFLKSLQSGILSCPLTYSLVANGIISEKFGNHFLPWIKNVTLENPKRIFSGPVKSRQRAQTHSSYGFTESNFRVPLEFMEQWSWDNTKNLYKSDFSFHCMNISQAPRWISIKELLQLYSTPPSSSGNKTYPGSVNLHIPGVPRNSNLYRG